MKKSLIFIIVVLIAIAAVVQLYGDFNSDADGLTLAEATYSVRTLETTDSTPFLVGKFLSEDGSRLVFDGAGGVRRIAQNLTETEGSYSLTQAKDGAAVISLDLGNGPALYTFSLTSPDDEFTLTDSANIAHRFTPLEY